MKNIIQLHFKTVINIFIRHFKDVLASCRETQSSEKRKKYFFDNKYPALFSEFSFDKKLFFREDIFKLLIFNFLIYSLDIDRSHVGIA